MGAGHNGRGRRRSTNRTALAIGVAVVAAAVVNLSGCSGGAAAPTSAAVATGTAPAPAPSTTSAGTGSPTGPASATAIDVVKDEQREWLRQGGQVFADAPLETFPVPASADEGLASCTDAQLAWLAKYGVASTEGIDLTAINAGDGTALMREYELTDVATPRATVTVRNLRVEGDFAPQSPARFAFACVNGGIGGDEAPYYEIATLGDSSPATYVAAPDAATFFDKGQLLDAGLDRTPFSATVEPGGTFRLNLVLRSADASQDFRGRIVADVVIGDQTYQEVLDDGYLQTAPASLTTVYAIAGFGRLFCLTDEAAFQRAVTDGVAGGDYDSLAPYACTPHELAAMVAAAT